MTEWHATPLPQSKIFCGSGPPHATIDTRASASASACHSVAARLWGISINLRTFDFIGPPSRGRRGVGEAAIAIGNDLRPGLA